MNKVSFIFLAAAVFLSSAVVGSQAVATSSPGVATATLIDVVKVNYNSTIVSDVSRPKYIITHRQRFKRVLPCDKIIGQTGSATCLQILVEFE